MWNSCLKHGKGTDIFANGDIYVGEYKNGKPDGDGTYTWSNGATYVGQFKLGMKHGYGKWRKSADNPTNIYEGYYFENKK